MPYYVHGKLMYAVKVSSTLSLANVLVVIKICFAGIRIFKAKKFKVGRRVKGLVWQKSTQ